MARATTEQSFALLDRLPVAVAIVDPEGRIEHLNAAGRAAIGQLRGVRLDGTAAGIRSAFVRSDGSPMVEEEAPAEITRRTGRELRDEVVGVPFADGTTHWLRVSTRRDGSGPPYRVVVTFVDVTEAREYEMRLASMERMFRLSMRNAPIGKGIVEVATRRTIQVNEALARMTGRSERSLLERDLLDDVHPDDVPVVGVLLDELLGGERDGMRTTLRYAHASGDELWIDFSASLVRRDDGTPELLICQILDVTAEHETESALLEAEERFRLAFDAAPTGIALLSPTGRFLRVNPALCLMTGHGQAELLALRLQDLMHPDDALEAIDRQRRMLAGERARYEFETGYVRADGTTVPALLSASVARDDRGVPRYVVVQVQDISERKRREQELEYMADHDVLTGLANRRHLAADLARRLAEQRRHGLPFSVVLLDLDHFKRVNDSLGHHVGDRMLRVVAGVLRGRVRETDLVARLGGDEFAVVLPDTTRKGAAELAGQLIEALRATRIDLGDRELRVSASAGVVCADPAQHPDEAALLEAADAAMYEAKEAGRDRFAVRRRSPRQTEPARGWSQRIQQALDDDSLAVHYQPILDLDHDRVCQYEALVRLDDADDRIPVPAAEFLDAAERYGLMPAIDRWVTARVIDDLASGAVPSDATVSVNVSARSLVDDALADLLAARAAGRDLRPGRLSFELKETVAIARLEEARRFAGRLLQVGCGLTLDDVGGGIGGLAHIRDLPYDTVKVDGDLVRTMTTNPQDRAVVEALVHIAHVTGRQAVAEFVGDRETLSVVCGLGIDMAQGFHIGAPVPVSQLRNAPWVA